MDAEDDAQHLVGGGARETATHGERLVVAAVLAMVNLSRLCKYSHRRCNFTAPAAGNADQGGASSVRVWWQRTPRRWCRCPAGVDGQSGHRTGTGFRGADRPRGRPFGGRCALRGPDSARYALGVPVSGERAHPSTDRDRDESFAFQAEIEVRSVAPYECERVPGTRGPKRVPRGETTGTCAPLNGTMSGAGSLRSRSRPVAPSFDYAVCVWLNSCCSSRHRHSQGDCQDISTATATLRRRRS